jgi:tRNA A-37 threonylcarbamoyl transferase component Bud32
VGAGLCTISQAINSLNEYDRERLAALRRHLAAYLKQFPKTRDADVEERFEKITERMRKLIKDQ